MTQGEPREALDREELLERLVLRRTKLTSEEALLLRAVFPSIFAAHHDQVWNRLRRRGLSAQEAEDLVQEVFLSLHGHILEHGFPESLPAQVNAITLGMLLNHLRTQKRAPFSLGLPSSGAEKPGSRPDAERVLALRDLAQQLFAELSTEHRSVIETVVLRGLAHHEAAAVLGLPEGTLKTRLMAAKRALGAVAEKLLPPSQRAAG